MSDMKIPELGAASLARRYYNHVLNGGTLSAADVGRLVETIEKLESLVSEMAHRVTGESHE